MITSETQNLDKEQPKSVGDRRGQIGVSQQIKEATKAAALAYAMKHKLTMAETFERAITLLIESDTTPQSEKMDLRYYPDDARDLSEVTLKFTHSEMEAIRSRFGILSLDGGIESFLKDETNLLEPLKSKHRNVRQGRGL